MAYQIIQQPDGLFAIWSTISDSVICYDATEEEIVAEIADKERERTASGVKEIIEALKDGKKPYFQFTRTWNEVKRTISKKPGQS